MHKRPNRSRSTIDRRAFIAAGGAAAAAFASGAATRAFGQDVRHAQPSSVVTTTSGSVRGVALDGGVQAFYGVPYGAPTSGDNRFMPPRPSRAWSGVREMTLVGNRSPQTSAGPISEVHALDRQEAMGEDCLNLNVFTPATGQGDRPVMVWLHGGGFTSGSGNWLLYDGARLARSQDVVVVPITHRLNVFGFLHLAEIGGEKYRAASNVGMLDIVAGLEWVRDNIAAFGGDPRNVTIFGQSGGGGKVSALLGMPAARGLFHRAIGMSGALLDGTPQAQATEATERFMSTLGVRSVEAMQRLPMERVLEAYLAQGGVGMSPTVDGTTLPAGPFSGSAPEIARDVPLMVGSTEHEINFFGNTPLDEINASTLLELVGQALGADATAARAAIDVYRAGRPGAANVEIYQTLASDARFRTAVTTQAELKAAQGAAPVYAYYFRWPSVVREGKLKAYHCIDIPFAFDNVEVATSMTGTTQNRYALASRMSAAFAAFARTGNPNTAGVPQWPTFDSGKRATMFIHDEWGVVDDPHRDERRVLARARRAG